MNEIRATSVDSDSRRFSKALRSAILWPVCVILFTALLMLAMIVMFMKVAKWSEHSYAVIAQTRGCESLVADAQSELRGFLLTGSHAFPALLQARRAQADAAFLKLAQLVKDNPPQAARAEGLIQTKNIWFDHAQGSLNQRLQQGAAANGDWIKMGGDVMESLREQFRTFTRIEEQVHDDRLARLQATKRGLGVLGGGLALVLALTVGQLVRRQFMALAIDYRSALHTIEQRHAALLRSEADLEEQKEWFRVTLTSIGDGVIVTDPESRIVFMNHEAERLTGWNGVESLLKPLSTVFHIVDEKSREKEEDPAGRAFREKKTVGLAGPALLLSKTGEEWAVEDSTAPIHDAAGRVLGVVLVFRNATDTRREQNALRVHSEDLEKRVAERTTALRQTVSELEAFSYTVSHDLRSPLRAMQGFAQAVLEDYGPRLDEQGVNYLQRIKNAAERLDRLIQDLLAYTRISRQNAPLVPIDLDKLVRELIQHYPNLHPPAAEVRIEGTLPRVLGQESSLTQVVSNLLGNAAKFVAEGVAPQIRIWSEEAEGRARLWIEDNGIGLRPEDAARIFQMFVQVNESQLYGGTGVGLAIVRKAVESMQGAVGVVPAEKGGSRFWFELAQLREIFLSRDGRAWTDAFNFVTFSFSCWNNFTMSAPNSSETRVRVLVVEDNDDDRELLLRQLRKTGMDSHVKFISHGQEAVDFLTKPRAVALTEDLIAVFLDLKLPGVGGLEVLRRLRQRDEFRELPVIVMTSSNDPEDLEECRRLKVTNYVSKPVTFTSFSKAVADVFHLPRLQQPGPVKE